MAENDLTELNTMYIIFFLKKKLSRITRVHKKGTNAPSKSAHEFMIRAAIACMHTQRTHALPFTSVHKKTQ